MSNASRACWRTDQGVGPLIERVNGVERIGHLLGAEMVVHGVQHAAAGDKPLVVHPTGQTQVTHLEIAAGRVGTQAESGVRRTQIARARIDVGLRGNADVRRQVVARSEFVRHHAAHAGVLKCRAGPIAGEHVVRAALVRRLAVRHGPADRDLVHHLGGLLPELAEPHALHVGVDAAERTPILHRCKGLRVKGLLVSHAARQENEDDRLGRPFLALVELLIRPGLLRPKEIGQTQPDSTNESNVQKVTACQTVTHRMGLLRTTERAIFVSTPIDAFCGERFVMACCGKPKAKQSRGGQRGGTNLPDCRAKESGR